MKGEKKHYYRPDIDGLRALAIIPVVLYHANILGFSGGFIGVDIFFVISGYLITSIILREIKNGSFSFINFWSRRIQRIVPALSVVLIVTSVFSYFIILYPGDLIDFGQSLYAQSFFLGNVLFMRRGGYFASPTDTMPLIHTWSLSVEEQFYLFFPAILLILSFLKKRMFLLSILIIGVLSFVINIYLIEMEPSIQFSLPFILDIWGVTTNASAGFYLLPSRAWEFVIGAILAITALKIRAQWFAEVISLVGIFFILYAITTYTPSTPFPGYAALLPVLGSAALILSNTHSRTFVGKILSFPVFVWVGLISYSLYLWHWPVFVLARASIFGTTKEMNFLPLILLSIVLAWLTYQFIETPFRKRALQNKQKEIMILGLGTLFTIAALGALIQVSEQKLIDRLPDAGSIIVNEMNEFKLLATRCNASAHLLGLDSESPCILGEPQQNVSPDFVLWGDSHATALIPLFEHIANEKNLFGIAFIQQGCPPIKDLRKDFGEEECFKTKEAARDYIEMFNVKKVILVSRWDTYMKHEVSKNEGDLIVESNISRKSQDEQKIDFKENLLTEISNFTDRGVHVYIFKQVPEHPNKGQRELFYGELHNSLSQKRYTISLDEHLDYNEFTDSVIDSISYNNNLVHVIDPSVMFCIKKDICTMYTGEKLLYLDSDHVNTAGALLLEPLVRDLF